MAVDLDRSDAVPAAAAGIEMMARGGIALLPVQVLPSAAELTWTAARGLAASLPTLSQSPSPSPSLSLSASPVSALVVITTATIVFAPMVMSMLPLLVLAALLVLVLVLLGVAAYRLALHPLASVPGPRLAALSGAWYAHQVRCGRAAAMGAMLHREYGPVVRVAPGEVWFSSREAFDVIYNTTRGFEKTDFYLATSLVVDRVDWRLRAHLPDSLDLLSERDVKRYRLQRRLIGRVYQAANIFKHESAVDNVLERVVERIRGLNGAEVDLREWMHIIAVECLGAVVLSWSPGLLRDGTDWGASTHSYYGWRRKSVLGLFPTMAKLGLRYPWVDRAFRDIWGLTFTSPRNFKSFFPDVGKQVNRRINVALKSTRTKPQPNPNASRKKKRTPNEAQGDPDSMRCDLLDDLIRLHREKPDFTETYLRKMAVTNFGAGHDTLASALTSALAMIGTHSDVRRRVAAEVRGLNDAAASENAGRVPLMRAAVREAMRLHPVIGMALPRRVPEGGAVLDGYWIPGGTTVGCNPAALHRDGSVVAGGSDPDLYDPDRWLDAADEDDEDDGGIDDGEQGGGGGGEARRERVRTMERCSLSWGGGGRTCPGKHLAEMIVHKVIAGLLARFDIEVRMPPGEGEGEGEGKGLEGKPSYFLSMMTGVKVRFLAAKGTEDQHSD